jgi:3-ketosteroid 9alpha-monooxygenase subunit A
VSEQSLSTFAKGWFVVCWSTDLPKAGVKPLRYLGRDLVAYRGEDGVARVLDAHCPHLGAHLGVGGTVCGNEIQCPFHAWRFGETGACTAVPYAKRIPPGAKVGAWITREVNGVVMVWHDPAGRAPDFEVPQIPDYGSPEWLPWACGEYHIATHPREIVENLADKGHFPAVHRTEIDFFDFSVDGVRATQRVKGRAILPTGGVDNFSSTTTYHGPAYLVMRMDGALSNYMIFAHTPIDEGHLSLRMGVTLKIVGDKSTTEKWVDGYMANLKSGFEDDIRIWEHKVFREKPTLCDGDGPLAQLRKWYRQFYVIPGGQAPMAISATE